MRKTRVLITMSFFILNLHFSLKPMDPSIQLCSQQIPSPADHKTLLTLTSYEKQDLPDGSWKLQATIPADPDTRCQVLTLWSDSSWEVYYPDTDESTLWSPGQEVRNISPNPRYCYSGGHPKLLANKYGIRIMLKRAVKAGIVSLDEAQKADPSPELGPLVKSKAS